MQAVDCRVPREITKFINWNFLRCVCDKFHDYLYGNQFEVITDNNPLTYVLTTAKLDATGHRWLASLASYQFNIKYRPGKNHANADGLSCLPAITSETEKQVKLPGMTWEQVYSHTIQAVCHYAQVVPENMPLVEILAMDAGVIPDALTDPPLLPGHVPCRLYENQWQQLQKDDPVVSPILECVETGIQLSNYLNYDSFGNIWLEM